MGMFYDKVEDVFAERVINSLGYKMRHWNDLVRLLYGGHG